MASPLKSSGPSFPTVIKVTGAKQNNLKNLDLEIPLEKFVCITGPSGSGKSSLAFDTLYAEGYRRYVESLSTYARQFFERIPKPDVDSIENICPAIALQQSNHVRNSRSTVGTSTEVYDYLRLLFAKVGQTFCPGCQKPIKAETPQSGTDAVLEVIGEKSDRAFVGFLAQENQPADFWIERGFLRKLKSLTEPSPLELEAERGQKIKMKTPIVFDRLVVSLKDKHRLTESIEGSFRQGGGEAFVYLVESKKLLKFSSKFVCSSCDTPVMKPSPLLFSFNSPLGACEACKGFGNILDYDEKLLIPNPRLSLERGAIEPFTKPMMKSAQKKFLEFAKKKDISTTTAYQDLFDEDRKILWKGDSSYRGLLSHFKKLETKKYKLHVRVFLRRYQSAFFCKTCKGSRLRPDALNVKVKTKTIQEVCDFALTDLEKWFSSISWTAGELLINKEIIRQIGSRIKFLNRMGVGYLSLSRLAKTLSGGETQRINLANQLGAELSGTLYVLDEPSIGLHPVDRDRMIQSLKDLVSFGNSVVVVEHDLDTIQAADVVLELGPKSGRQGGELVFQGTQAEFRKSNALTAQYIRGEQSIPLPSLRRKTADHWLSIQGASENNLQNCSLNLPLLRLTGIAGVSGSGKTTLIHQTLFNALARLLHHSIEPIGKFKKLFGSERIKGVVMLDQTPVGRSSRSIPLTMMGAYDEVRALYSSAAKSRGKDFLPKAFSFNLPGGRCETCQGEGVVRTEMYFLEDLFLVCEDCQGKRFKKEVLDIKIRGKNVYDIFQMTVSEGRGFFRESAGLMGRLEMLERVGLGYLQLGQSSHTLSGGESQRLKIASELMDRRRKGFLYILDEPTTGLHISEVELLIRLLQSLVDSGNTVVVIEHNIDVLKSVDWLIELGPGAGKDGGRIVGEGAPEEIAKGKTATGPFLKHSLQNESVRSAV